MTATNRAAGVNPVKANIVLFGALFANLGMWIGVQSGTPSLCRQPTDVNGESYPTGGPGRCRCHASHFQNSHLNQLLGQNGEGPVMTPVYIPEGSPKDVVLACGMVEPWRNSRRRYGRVRTSRESSPAISHNISCARYPLRMSAACESLAFSTDWFARPSAQESRWAISSTAGFVRSGTQSR